MAGKPLRVTLIADPKKFKSGLSKASKDLDSFGKRAGKTMAGVGKATAAAAAGGLAAFGAFAIQGAKKFIVLEKKVREVGTLLGDVSKADLSQLTKEIESVATATGQAAQEVAQGFYDSISAGIPRESVEQFVRDAAKFATAGATEIGSAVDLLTSSLNAFGLNASEALSVSDTFFGTVKLGKTTVEELGSSFSVMGPLAAAAGLKLEDVGGALAAMTLQGTPTAQAATQIRAILASLLKTGSKTANFFEKIAGKSFQQFIKDGNSFTDAITLMDTSLKDTGQTATEVFGRVEAATGFLSISGPNLEKFSGLVDELGGAAGSTETAFGVMSKSAATNFNKLREQFDATQRSVGQHLIPIAAHILPDLLYAFQKLGPGVADATASFSASFIRAYDTIDVAIQETIYHSFRFGKQIRSWLSESITNYLIPAFEAAATAAQALRGPWALVIKVAEKMWETWGHLLIPVLEEVGEYLNGMVQTIRSNFLPVTDKLVKGLKAIWEVVQPALIPALKSLQAVWDHLFGNAIRAAGQALGKLDEWWGKLVDRIGNRSKSDSVTGRFGGLVDFWNDHLKPALMAIGGFVREVLVPAFLWLKDQIVTAIGYAVGFIKDRFDFVIDILKFAWETIVNVISFALDTITGVFTIFTGIFTGDWSKVWDGVKTIFGGAWEFITNLFKSVTKLLGGLVRELGEMVRGIWGVLWDWVGGKFKGVWNGLVSFFKAVVNSYVGMFEGMANAFVKGINWIIRKWNDFRIRFPGLKILDVQIIPSFTWDTPNIPTIPQINIPRLAKGGIVTGPTLALLGEAGRPEVVQPLPPGGMLGGGVTVNFYGDVYGDQYALGDLVVDAISDWQRRNGPLDLTIGRT